MASTQPRAARSGSRYALYAAAALSAYAAADVRPALAQETVLLPPLVLEDFDRGRNLSVTQRQRPDYDPVGIDIGTFSVLPQITTGVGVTSNVYLRSANPISDGYFWLNPSIVASSTWSRHSLRLRANTTNVRFFDQTVRNQDAMDLAAVGRLDISSEYSVTADGQYATQYESPLSGETTAELATVSRYGRSFMGIRGERIAGYTRLRLALDRTDFTFSDIRLPDRVVDQGDRDRAIVRGIAQFDYALSPSLAVYGQVTRDDIDYDTFLNGGLANRDSTGTRILGGVNFDLAEIARGTVGVGYVWRNYEAGRYDDVSGFSVEARLELFPTELTTLTFTGRRLIADANLGASAAFFDNRISAQVDHELLRNLLLNARADFAYIDYIDSAADSTVIRLSGGARYLVNRNLRFGGTVTYTNRGASGFGTGNEFDEFAGLFSVTFQR